MKTKLEKFENYCLMRLDGQFVGGDETDEFFNLAMGALADGCKNLVMDFKDVLYFSSISIGKLIKLNYEYNLKDSRLILTNVNKTLQDVFKITKVSSILRITLTMEEALEQVK